MRRLCLTVTLGTAAAVLIAATNVFAQESNPRFGVWKLDSSAPPPSNNIMTYEPYEDDGMRITVESTNARGQQSTWSYVTLFDGAFRPVAGQNSAETAVEVINESTTRISNARNGRVYQVIINTLLEDGDTISNEYVRLDEDGNIVRVTHATYRRIG
tara:strand:- start:173 stop:643 length:471 start_codon:yes stop_codon:yes gene_type:complete